MFEQSGSQERCLTLVKLLVPCIPAKDRDQFRSAASLRGMSGNSNGVVHRRDDDAPPHPAGSGTGQRVAGGEGAAPVRPAAAACPPGPARPSGEPAGPNGHTGDGSGRRAPAAAVAAAAVAGRPSEPPASASASSARAPPQQASKQFLGRVRAVLSEQQMARFKQTLTRMKAKAIAVTAAHETVLEIFETIQSAETRCPPFPLWTPNRHTSLGVLCELVC